MECSGMEPVVKLDNTLLTCCDQGKRAIIFIFLTVVGRLSRPLVGVPGHLDISENLRHFGTTALVERQARTE